MLRDEVQQILQELGEAIGAGRIWIAAAQPEAAPDPELISRGLGRGQALWVRLLGEGADSRHSEIERAARALRAAARRWAGGPLPEVSWPEGEEAPPPGRVIERIETYLRALAEVAGCTNVLVTRRSGLVAAAREPSELERDRIEFAVKRVEADAVSRDGTSHGEVVGEDLYVRSFYFDAALIAYFDGPWGIDFVRHRARQVCRELAHLLGMLEPTPPSDVVQAPRPE
jgi:hypothetical protein